MDSDVSESNNFVINTNKDRFKRFLNTYKRTLLVVIIPLIFIPIACVGQNNAYKSFYIFLVSATFFSGDILHPGVSSLLPIVLFTVMGGLNWTLISTINLSSSVLDCLGVMAIILAIEHSTIHKRVALKVLLIIGCSHFRLSFLLFVSATMLSMWFGECMACGLMMPLVKAILKELEKARTLGMDPRYLMIPATLACSMAFHMPVGTPPNAIVAGVAHIPTSKMAIGGIGPKIITTLIVWGAYPTWGSLIFKPEDIAGLDGGTSLSQKGNMTLNCDVLAKNLNSDMPFNCTTSVSKISNKTLALQLSNSSFTCNYLPFEKS